ncbi:MAG: beta-1,4-galactosyltransferase [Candidatus Hydrogenedentes bacterium]|nr:beta-1,4-galactosyltransferase [Candidatus Hydrogenedentota bacterium]
MIYVTVGTMFLDFPRLIRAMDVIARDTGEQVIIQTGMGNTVPQHCEHFAFKPREEVLEIQRGARVVVCHAGIGCVSDALRMRRPLIVVPRLKRFREHMNDHQLELARAVESRGWGRVIHDIGELPDACANPPRAVENYTPARAPLIADIKEFVDGIAARKRNQ